MKEFTEEYLSNLNQLIENKEEELVKEQIQDLHPADIAELVGDLDIDDALFIMLLLDDETAGDVLVELDEDGRICWKRCPMRKSPSSLSRWTPTMRLT